MRDALILGVIAAVAWGGLGITLTHAARLSGPWTTLLWMGLTSTTLTAIAASFTGPPGGEPKDWALVAIAGIAYTGNLVFYMMAIRGGEVSLVAPIVGCDGAFAALLAVAAGEALGIGPAIGLLAMVAALLLVTTAGAPTEEQVTARASLPDRRSTANVVMLALACAFCFGTVFFLSGKATGINPLWVVAVVRVPSIVIAFFVCLRTGMVSPPLAARPWLAASGVIDALAFICYVEGARHSLAIAAVAASQYAIPAAIAGAVVFGERLRPTQWLGVGVLISAAALIAATG
ncbi:MAG: EamA family transporter [Actinobacteria bacterium]|nr:EamA family transporter [Actinomycetota bacterium]